MTDWVQWHTRYDHPGSSLARRLIVVRRRLEEALAVRLLDRSTRTVELTRVGRELAQTFDGF